MNHARNGRLDGKKTIVTGASKGIGAAIARLFVLEGADAVVNYNSSEAQATELVKSLNSQGNGRAFFPKGMFRKSATLRRWFTTQERKWEELMCWSTMQVSSSQKISSRLLKKNLIESLMSI